MAVAYMTSVNISNYDPNIVNKSWEYEDTLAAASNGSSVILPNNIKSIQVTLVVTAGSGKVQTTTSSIAKVIAGTETWVDWDLGVVAATSQDACLPVTAIRQVNVSGTTVLQLRAQ